MNQEQYNSLLAGMDTGAATCSLEQFREAEELDPNFRWRIGHGHLANLLDEALERIDELTSDRTVELNELARGRRAHPDEWVLAERAAYPNNAMKYKRRGLKTRLVTVDLKSRRYDIWVRWSEEDLDGRKRVNKGRPPA